MKFLACDSTASPRAYQSKERLRSVGRSLQCWALTSCMWLTHRRAMAISALHLTALSSSSTFAGVQERGRMFAACIRLAPVFLTRTCDPCMLSSCARRRTCVVCSITRFCAKHQYHAPSTLVSANREQAAGSLPRNCRVGFQHCLYCYCTSTCTYLRSFALIDLTCLHIE